MRLKSVRIFGFKTFAEKTEFSLDGGIIAVVGPNGCGKSNLVDAILWGLGEGNVRHLRAQSGPDVIFSGSARRKGVGFCEVTLLFDNEDGVLPVPSPEVSVTRRLTRSGESDYSINRRSCRQRDIYELLADSGLGRTGYSIVGQKQIDSALSASSDERRTWIDEAAGVQRYRQRKVEALRKLDAARDHLQRVADILRELDSQREPLREQAEEAAKYRRIQAALREVEVSYLGSEFLASVAEQLRLQEQIEVASKLVDSETFRAAAHESRISEIHSEITKIDDSLAEERSKAENARSRVLRAEAEIRVGQSKLENLVNQENSFAADRLELASRIEEASLELDRLQSELLLEQDLAQEVRSATAGFGEETRHLSVALDDAERALKTANQREISRLRRQNEREHLVEKRKMATRELDSLVRNFGDLETSVEDARLAVEASSLKLERLKESARNLLTEELALKAAEDRESGQMRSILSERAALEGRERGIESTIEGLEGMTQGSRAVLDACAKGQLKGRYVTVGQTIQSEKAYALAIETALGAAVNDLIVENERDSQTAIEYLKAHRLGRATFQPISLMRKVEISPDLRRLLSEHGVLGLASELVSYEPNFRPVIDSLLGRIPIVESLSVALKFAKTKGWNRIATVEGEVVFSSGAVTGGAQARQSYGVLQRKADLVGLRKQIDDITDRVEVFYLHSKDRERQALQIGETMKATRALIAEQEETLSELRSYYRSLSDELKSTVKERLRLEKELAIVLPLVELSTNEVALAEDLRNVALRHLAAKSADAEISEERLRESEKRLGQAMSRVDAALRRRELALDSEKLRLKRAGAILPERDRLTSALKHDARVRDVAVGDEQSARQSLEFIQALKQSVLIEREKEQNSLFVAKQTLSDTGNLLHQFEISRTRTESRRLNAVSKLTEEYGIFESELRELTLSPTPADAPSLIARLRRDLRAIGDVNLGAIEAYDRLTIRFQELSAQSEDILGGISEVERSIKELDQLTRERFVATFAELQKRFAEVFERIFPGGVGAIHLTSAEEVLSSGIEIDVTLPGKRRQPLSLLSGGEQSLCTAAFLFALLLVKPSPLVVLDEVDAPLDGRNVERYADLLKSMSSTMQFIVITHNPVTIEAATTWLGVTMQEPGVSTLVPTKVPSTLRENAKSA